MGAQPEFATASVTAAASADRDGLSVRSRTPSSQPRPQSRRTSAGFPRSSTPRIGSRCHGGRGAFAHFRPIERQDDPVAWRETLEHLGVLPVGQAAADDHRGERVVTDDEHSAARQERGCRDANRLRADLEDH